MNISNIKAIAGSDFDAIFKPRMVKNDLFVYSATINFVPLHLSVPTAIHYK